MSIIGTIVGDVIGSRFERKAVPRELETLDLITQDSKFSDDTVLTLATADVIFNRAYDGDYAKAYRDYYAKYPNRCYGGMFIRWAKNEYAGPYGSFGNGSAMRISPIIDKYTWDWHSIEKEVVKSASVTHNHPEGIIGATALASMIWYAKTKHREAVSKTLLEIKRLAESVYSYDINAGPPERFDCTCQGTVPLAIKAVVESTDFDSCMRKCISFGGDVDTIAAMAGGIAAELWEIPSDLYVKTVHALGQDGILKPFKAEQNLLKQKKEKKEKEL